MSFELPGDSGIDTEGREKALARLHERREALFADLEEEEAKPLGERDEAKLVMMREELARLEAQEEMLVGLDTERE